MDTGIKKPCGVNEFYPLYCNTETQSWTGHLIFAGILMKEFRPRTFVELGTHFGNSYFSFCQSVAENGLDTRCYAVDSWAGEVQAGIYGEDVYRFVSEHNQANYASFSTLLRGMFDDFTGEFEDESIDLLHIDGFHSYEAVKHDFETWIGKVRPGGIVLFHDVAEHQEGFGVWRFWDEIRKCTEESFAFTHSSGLGIWRKPNGPALESSLLRTLFSGDESVVKFISNVAWRLPENMPIERTRHEYVELFVSPEKGKFSHESKSVRILVGAQCGQSVLEMGLVPGNGSFYRLDLGQLNWKYTITQLSIVDENGNTFDLLKEDHFTFLDVFAKSCTAEGKNVLEIIPYTNDPQLHFSFNGKLTGKTAVLILGFSSEKIDLFKIISERISLLNGNIALLQQQYESSCAENQELKKIREILSGECTALRENQSVLEKECIALRENLDVFEKECGALRENRDSFEKECTALRENLDVFEKECAALRENRDYFEKECSALRTSRSALEKECSALRENRDSFEKECTALRENLGVFEKECSALRENRDYFEKECIALRENLGVFEKECGALRENRDFFEKECGALRENRDYFEKECGALRENQRLLENARTDLEQRLAQLHEQYAGLERSWHELNGNHAKLNNEHQAVSDKYAALEQAYNDKCSVCTGLEQRLAEETAQKQNWITQHQVLTEEHNAFCVSAAQKEQLLNEEIMLLRNSKAYRLGRFLLAPFRKIRDLMK